MTTPETKASDTVRLEPTDFAQAEEIVNSDPVIRIYASCEWDELGENGKEWIAAIVRQARTLNTRPLSIPQGEEVERIVDAITPEMLRREDGRDTFAWVSAVAEKAAATLSTKAEVERLRAMEDAPTDGSSILILHEHHGWIEGRFYKGKWSEDTPISPAEYDGDAWILGDDLEQVEVENPDYPIATNLKGWLPIAALASMSPTLSPKDEAEEAKRESLGIERHGLMNSYGQSPFVDGLISKRIAEIDARLSTVSETTENPSARINGIRTGSNPVEGPNHASSPQSAPQPASQDEEGIVTLQTERGPIGVDTSIAPIVEALNKAGAPTIASCSGHGHRPGNIALRDGRELIIARNFEEARMIDALFPIASNGKLVGQSAPQVGGEVLISELRGVRDAMEHLEFHIREPDLEMTPATARAILRDAIAALTNTAPLVEALEKISRSQPHLPATMSAQIARQALSQYNGKGDRI